MADYIIITVRLIATLLFKILVFDFFLQRSYRCEY